MRRFLAQVLYGDIVCATTLAQLPQPLPLLYPSPLDVTSFPERVSRSARRASGSNVNLRGVSDETSRDRDEKNHQDGQSFDVLRT
jgi:hypothetical protein